MNPPPTSQFIAFVSLTNLGTVPEFLRDSPRVFAKNKTLDLLTRKATRPENGIRREWDAIPAAISSLSSCWDQEYRWELFVQAAKHVREAVAEATWQAFWLSTIENQPTADVARQLGVRQGMIYLSRCRVLDRIRKLLKQWESEE